MKSHFKLLSRPARVQFSQGSPEGRGGWPGLRSAWRAGRLGVLLGLVACWGEPPLASFTISKRTREQVPDANVSAAIFDQLERLFGQPNDPHLGAGPLPDGFDPRATAFGQLDESLLEAVRLDNGIRYFDFLAELEAGGSPAELDWPSSLKRLESSSAGASREEVIPLVREFHPSLGEAARSYSRQCVTCHGVGGGGDGPSARFQNPPPRDYGAAEFRHFPSSLRERPTHLDLIRVLRNGISGSGMPKFASRPASELSGLSDYVRFLALRGEVERALVDLTREGGSVDVQSADRLFEAAVNRWRAGDS